MELVADFSQYEQSSSSRKVKSRSKACLHCRRRKMRCDGVKPACFQCVRAERASECEYDDGVTKTGTQVLYERLAILEKRYRDLQAAKCLAQNRRAPSYPRVNASSAPSTRSSSTHLARSNSAPERVQSQPRVIGNESRNVSGAFISRHDTPQSLSFSSYVPSQSGSGFVPMDSNTHTPNLQPFDLNSSSLSSRSSPRSGRSTPSTSDLSHNEFAFHPKYAFTYGEPQRSTSQTPYIVSNADLTMGFPYDGIPLTDIPLPQPEMQNMTGHSKIPRQLSTNTPSIDEEIPPAMLEHLIDNFVAHSQQMGATILANRLVDILCISTSEPSSSMSCLVNCFLLIGAQFSNVESIRARKEHFLQRVLIALPTLLSEPLAIAEELRSCNPSSVTDYRNSDPTCDGRYNVVVAISASVMLATYFFAEGRALEGSYHANTASQLAICAGLHRTPDPRLWREDSSGNPESVSGQMAAANHAAHVAASSSCVDLLPYPGNKTVALERHFIFWDVFVLDRAWTAAGRVPAPSSRWSVAASEAARAIDGLKDKDSRTVVATAWPEDWELLLIEDAKDNKPVLPGTPSKTPVEDFLTGLDFTPTQSILQLRAKSTALFEAASRIASLRGSCEIESVYDSSFACFQRTLSRFLKSLPPLTAHDSRPASYSKSAQYMIYILVHAATIRLYSRLAEKAYRDGYYDNAIAIFKHDKNVKQIRVQSLIEGLLGYERVFSQDRMGDENAELGKTGRSRREFFGMVFAAADQCISSARDMVQVVSSIAPEDFSFLEPIVAPCWALASGVLLRELKRASIDPSSSVKDTLLSELRVLETSFKYLGAVFPIGNIEAKKLSSALSSIPGCNPPSVS